MCVELYLAQRHMEIAESKTTNEKNKKNKKAVVPRTRRPCGRLLPTWCASLITSDHRSTSAVLWFNPADGDLARFAAHAHGRAGRSHRHGASH
jgi:hypothetical protein